MITININEKLAETLTRLAGERSMTPETYIEEYVDNHLTSQFKQFVAAKVANESVDNVATLEEAIDISREEIKLASPVIEEVVIDTTTENMASTTPNNII